MNKSKGETQSPLRLPHSLTLWRPIEQLLPCSLQVEGEEATEDDVFFHLRRHFIRRPAIGIPHGEVEGGVEVLKPGGIGVVEVGEGALLQLRLACTVRIEPGVAFVVEVLGVGGDALHDGIIDRLLPWRPGEWVGLEA